MLSLPHAVSLVGMRAAIPLIIVYSLCSMFTIHLMTNLYLDLRRRKVIHALYLDLRQRKVIACSAG